MGAAVAVTARMISSPADSKSQSGARRAFASARALVSLASFASLALAACASDVPVPRGTTTSAQRQQPNVAVLDEAKARETFSKEFTCPADRIQITPAAPEPASGAEPSPEIANDPARLKLWQSQHDLEDQTAKKTWSYFAVEGCEHTARYRCNDTFARSLDSAMCGEDPAVMLAALQKQLAPFEFDNSDELFDCLTPGGCSRAFEQRARTRAASAFKCAADAITTHERATHGLSVVGGTMMFTPRGRAELHVQPGVKGDAAFDVEGCGKKGILACVPAHRVVVTSAGTYDNADDHVCVWARE